MSWKIVRDKNRAWCLAHGVSGQWRASPDPIAALTRKIAEEYGEFAEAGDPGELYDLLDVAERLVSLIDPDLEAWEKHKAKQREMGEFEELIEWTPVPEETRENP